MRSEKASGRLYVTSKGVNTGNAGREGFGLAAEQVHVCVVYGLVEARGGSAYHHLGAVEACGLVLLHNLRPQHTGGAEFCDFHKEVGRNAHIELNARSNFFGLATGISKQVHPSRAPCEGISEFLIDVCAGICENTAVNGDAPQAGNGSHNVEKSGGLGGKSSGIHAFYSVTELATQRIIVNRALERSLGTLLLDISNEGFCHCHSLAGTAVEVDFNTRKAYVLQENRHFGRVGNLEAKRIDAFSENIESDSVSFLGGIGHDDLSITLNISFSYQDHARRGTARGVCRLCQDRQCLRRGKRALR